MCLSNCCLYIFLIVLKRSWYRAVSHVALTAFTFQSAA